MRRHALVFGASGLIGRRLIAELVRGGVEVTAAVRSTESAGRVENWLAEHGVDRGVRTEVVDAGSPGFVSGGSTAFSTVTEIHNCAGAFRFGMTAGEARDANVGIVERLVDFAAGLPNLRRLVHVSGYRVGGQDPAGVPWTDEHRAKIYRKLGAYEASKAESDAIFQARAGERGLP